MKKIYPFDWKKIHPDHAAMSTDQYYSQLATRVLRVLEDDGITDVIEEEDDVRDVAVRLTAWFEDLCNGTGLWGVVNTVCQQRHGKALPFLDTTEYYPGEPNPQDIMLLLWDILQSHNEGRIINPENPGIAQAAMEIYDIFDQEYETAPETDEMMAYLADPALSGDYWQARKAMEWFALDSYLSLRTRLRYEESRPARIRNEHDDIMAYHQTLSHIFFDRHNLLALTSSEWLSAATGKKMDIDRTHCTPRLYDIASYDSTTALLHDTLNGTEVKVQMDSFSPNWIKDYLPTARTVMCNIVGFNGKYYQFGAMYTDPEEKYKEKYRQQQADIEHEKDNVQYTASLFPKAAGGEPIVFVKGIDEYMDFNTKRMGSKATDEFRRSMESYLRENAENGMAAFMMDDELGLLTITCSVPAIKAPNNPYYDEAYARQHALYLIVEPEFIDYSALCTLIDRGYLPDAALTSLQGYDHGRDLVQQNIQFMADYFFAEHR